MAIALASAALTVSVAASAHGRAHAAPTQLIRLELAANALKPAVRLSQAGVIMFPMNPAPRCWMSKSSFGQPRSGGRTHEGLDIMASLGQEVYAVDNGVLNRQSIDGAPNATLSGNAWTMRLPDRTEYFYGHLSRFAEGLTLGATVTRGQLIGYVGDTGNPGVGNYHLHFGVFPKGGAAVDPLPLLTVPKACTISA
ncbi:MAG: M23 family metallopeptidase [Actinomycetota bacterium]|nr:M23 family metallopeptidase [Actinomycetota bacterium]